MRKPPTRSITRFPEPETFISPDGNPEVWLEKPEGYFTQEEWDAKEGGTG